MMNLKGIPMLPKLDRLIEARAKYSSKKSRETSLFEFFSSFLSDQLELKRDFLLLLTNISPPNSMHEEYLCVSQSFSLLFISLSLSSFCHRHMRHCTLLECQMLSGANTTGNHEFYE